MAFASNFDFDFESFVPSTQFQPDDDDDDNDNRAIMFDDQANDGGGDDDDEVVFLYTKKGPSRSFQEPSLQINAPSTPSVPRRRSVRVVTPQQQSSVRSSPMDILDRQIESLQQLKLVRQLTTHVEQDSEDDNDDDDDGDDSLDLEPIPLEDCFDDVYDFESLRTFEASQFRWEDGAAMSNLSVERAQTPGQFQSHKQVWNNTVVVKAQQEQEATRDCRSSRELSPATVMDIDNEQTFDDHLMVDIVHRVLDEQTHMDADAWESMTRL